MSIWALGVITRCEVCEGRRFTGQAQEDHVAGKNFADVFEMSVTDAPDCVAQPAIRRMLSRLIDAGSTLVVIEHNLNIIAAADWIIDLGPEAGHDGGQVIFEDPPDPMAADGNTHTAEHLRRHFSGIGPGLPR
ncbi:hypothetical protein ONR57_01600 [Hoyosella sp. YIM 151337]|uniref:hypothetical protein n=1 Tax=Hoyosella sp. YIM 151337 TaxID=2992742 RepID=UPI00223585B5|nr:hypothetical protein [Hoyosella sp. YIM 151337]MCW4351994.1 hypothetical protein [Hoyosella sp. YIM 151337]